MTARSSGASALAIVVVAVAGAFVLLWSIWPSRPPAAPPTSPHESRTDGAPAPRAPSPPAAAVSPPPASASRLPTTTVPPPPAATEPALLATLRLMVETAPQQSLDLAREARRRFGSSPHAAERDWIIVKSLVNLRRFHDARDEAKALVAQYPDTAWAQDVRRHLLVNPLDQPSREEMQRRDAGQP